MLVLQKGHRLQEKNAWPRGGGRVQGREPGVRDSPGGEKKLGLRTYLPHPGDEKMTTSSHLEKAVWEGRGPPQKRREVEVLSALGT